MSDEVVNNKQVVSFSKLWWVGLLALGSAAIANFVFTQLPKVHLMSHLLSQREAQVALCNHSLR